MVLEYPVAATDEVRHVVHPEHLPDGVWLVAHVPLEVDRDELRARFQAVWHDRHDMDGLWHEHVVEGFMQRPGGWLGHEDGSDTDTGLGSERQTSYGSAPRALARDEYEVISTTDPLGSCKE